MKDRESPKLGFPVDIKDDKYVSELSTILVATIQEAKDRISQIEYIFCSQLYPNFQSKSKSLHKFYSDARRVVEDEWKEKEKGLLLQIEKMRVENQRVLEENRSLKLEKSKKTGPMEQELVLKQQKIDELEQQLRKKSLEIDEGMVLQKDLVSLVQSKASLVLEKELRIKDGEVEAKRLLEKVGILEKEVENLRAGLSKEMGRMVKEIELTERLYAKNLELGSEIGDSEKEKKRLLKKVEELEEDVIRIRKELKAKVEQVSEGEELQKQLIQQIDLKGSEILENKERMDEREKEKRLLLDKVTSLEERVNQLVTEKSDADEMSKGTSSCEKLLEQIESMTFELQAEKKKRRDVIDAYKRLKSQYIFLCTKVGLTAENVSPQNKLEYDSESCRNEKNETNALGPNRNPDAAIINSHTIKVKDEILDDDQEVKSNSPAFVAPKCASHKKSIPVSSTKVHFS